MRVLIVTAHPSSKGFTHKIAESYKVGVESSGGEVEILDLYKESNKQGYLSFENIKDVSTDSVRDLYQQKITEANHIVFIHPLWWGSMPAVMKNFIDCNLTARFAYKYVKGRPVGLLKGRTASVYVTCDGSMWLYRLLFSPFKITWRFIILGVCGLKVKNISVLDKKFKRTEKELNNFLEEVRKVAKKVN